MDLSGGISAISKSSSDSNAPLAERCREQFHFHGSGGEYFRIWIVNLLLTILTLGIYSAWAKVRKNRYIYGSLELAGSRFDYTAGPLLILRGRLIAMALLLAFVASQSFFPPLYLATFFIIGVVTPWLIVRSRMFNMRYTTYRNIRFSFQPAYAESYKTIFLYGFLAIITLGAAAPYAHFKRSSFVVGNTRYGNLDFKLGDIAGKFYFAYFIGACLGLLMLGPLIAMIMQLSGSLTTGSEDLGESQQFVMTLLPAFAGLIFYYVIGKTVAALVLRITTNNTAISGESGSHEHRMYCDWSLPGMLWINVTNLLALVASIGLLTPWAQMRTLKYQLDHTWLDVSADIEAVVAGQAEKVSSIGEEIGDVFDVDIGL